MIEVFKTTLNLEELKVKREKLNARNFEIQLLGGSIAVLTGIYIVMKTKRQHEAEKAAETERILKTPMQDLAKSSENDPLVDKYK